MNVFFDTSALLGLYVRDTWSKQARASAAKARVFVSVLAYAELLAAVGRLTREGAITERERSLTEHAFVDEWKSFSRSAFDARLLPEVRRVLKIHALAGADAVQLATALTLHRRLDGDLEFACGDKRLMRAAANEGIAPAWPALAAL